MNIVARIKLRRKLIVYTFATGYYSYPQRYAAPYLTGTMVFVYSDEKAAK